MSFDNHYPNRKDNRRKYYSYAKKICRGCRNHGQCPWCQRSVKVKKRKQEPME